MSRYVDRLPAILFCVPLCMALIAVADLPAAELGTTPVYGVAEITFTGPAQSARDTPARDIELTALFRHETWVRQNMVYGFYDGDGQGGIEGNVFKIRFCPPEAGVWIIVDVKSNRPELSGQHLGDTIVAEPSNLHGFWEVAEDAPGLRWYRRSDDTRQYIIGNTHYGFLSECGPEGQPTGGRIDPDVRRNAEYFKKLRFSLTGDRYPHPTDKPFLDDAGRPTDDGDYSHRPNPRWFHERADWAVRTAHQVDLIADLILCGPDTDESRSTLRVEANKGGVEPWLRYIAARYGSYPNVWFCLCNEFDVKSPRYVPDQIVAMGQTLRRHLTYTTPLSVHTVPETLWPAEFDGLPPWNDHQIIQKKLRDIGSSADVIQQTWLGPAGDALRQKPTINDELSYQGDGDKHSEADTVAAHVGAFLGGGYGSTGYKPANKEGQYFWGKFDPREHSAADNLKWLRELIDREMPFTHMTPDMTIFENTGPGFRGLARADQTYVLGTDEARTGVTANLPPGNWKVTRYDVLTMSSTIVEKLAAGPFKFNTPDSRAVLFCFQRQ